MAAIPTFAQEDAKGPHREREGRVGGQITIFNRIKATLARLGIRNFNAKLKKAADRLEHVRTPEGEPIPPTRWQSSAANMQRRQGFRDQGSGS